MQNFPQTYSETKKELTSMSILQIMMFFGQLLTFTDHSYKKVKN